MEEKEGAVACVGDDGSGLAWSVAFVLRDLCQTLGKY